MIMDRRAASYRPTAPARWRPLLPAAAALLAGSTLALAAATGSTSAFKGFGGNHDPIQIEADNLGVVGPDQIVTITGNVQVRQKDTTLTTQILKVFYESKSGDPAQPPTDPQAGTQLRRFEAAGGVKITQPDQTVTGESGWFDMTTQKAEIDGNVILTQCKNIAKGSKLLVNLKTGEYRLEGGPKERVTILLDSKEKPAGSTEGKCK